MNEEGMTVSDDLSGAEPQGQDTFEVGQGSTPMGDDTPDTTPDVTPEPTPEPTPSTADAPKPDPVSSVAERLGGGGEQAQKPSEVVNPKNTMPFDVTQLSPDQLRALKAALNNTPEGREREKEKPRITLRRIDGRYIIDFKNAYLGVVRDVELNRDVERHKIPVRFFNQEEYEQMLKGEEVQVHYEDILYSEFMNAERVPCEVLRLTQEKKPYEIGETYSQQRGGMVVMERVEVVSYFDVQLPDGYVIKQLEGKIVNA